MLAMRSACCLLRFNCIKPLQRYHRLIGPCLCVLVVGAAIPMEPHGSQRAEQVHRLTCRRRLQVSDL